MSRLILSIDLTAVRTTITCPTPAAAAQRAIHTVSLAPLPSTLHQRTEPVLQLHDLHLHYHHSYQQSSSTTTSKPRNQQLNISTSKIKQSNISNPKLQQPTISNSVKESKILRELRESCARQAAIGQETDFREVHGRTLTLSNMGIWDVTTTSIPTDAVKKVEAQIIASKAITSSILSGKEKMKDEKAVKVGVKNHVGVRRGMNRC